jgi:hypothetical protein
VKLFLYINTVIDAIFRNINRLIHFSDVTPLYGQLIIFLGINRLFYCCCVFELEHFTILIINTQISIFRVSEDTCNNKSDEL